LIDKFNFYDVYGYLMPGVALLAMLWLPFGILLKKWPPTDLGAAVGVLIVAYIVGHIIHSITGGALSVTQKDSVGVARVPSDIVLDPDEGTTNLPDYLKLPSDLKKNLQTCVTEAFGIDLRLGSRGNHDETDKSRRNAFLLCRNALIVRKLGSYAEQYQSMYALTRSLTIAFCFGSAYLAGWAVATWKNAYSQLLLPVCLIVLLLVAIAISIIPAAVKGERALRARLGKGTFIVVLIAMFCVGTYFGWRLNVSGGETLPFFVMALFGAFAAAKCFRAYQLSAAEFAKAVWRDFLGFSMCPPPSSAGEKE